MKKRRQDVRFHDLRISLRDSSSYIISFALNYLVCSLSLFFNHQIISAVNVTRFFWENGKINREQRTDA